MKDLGDLTNPRDLCEALARHPYPERCRMVAQLLRGKATDGAHLARRARFVTLLRERELWPMSPR